MDFNTTRETKSGWQENTTLQNKELRKVLNFYRSKDMDFDTTREAKSGLAGEYNTSKQRITDKF